LLVQGFRAVRWRGGVYCPKGPWYRWTLDRLGLKHQYQRFGIRNIVERFFEYLKKRTEIL